MALDLFTGLAEGAGLLQTTVANAEPAQDDVPALIRHYIEAWPRYLATIEQADAAVRDLRAQEKALGSASRAWSWSPTDRWNERYLACSVLDAITAYAREQLCRGDVTVLSDRDAENLIEDSRALRRDGEPNFLAYWRALESRYGGGIGQRQALARAARNLRTTMGIPSSSQEERSGRRAPPKMERGGVTFDLCLHALDHAISGGGYRLSHYGSTGIRKLTGELAAVLGSEFDAAPHVSHFDRLTGGFPIPYRTEIAGCRWTLLKEATRLWLPQGLALSLRAVLDELDP